MGKFSHGPTPGMQEAAAIAAGQDVPARAHVAALPDVRAIRRRLRMSQQGFAAAYRIPLATLRNWEQRRRAPDAPAAAYLLAIARRPEVIRAALLEEEAPA